LKEANENPDVDLIGQFGVGFYSAFMVADEVTLITKAAGEEKGVLWKSSGDGTYTIDEFDKEKRGTEIRLHMREIDADKDDENYVDQNKVEALVKKYSDYVRWPVSMDFYTDKPEEKDDDGKVTKEAETVVESRIMNSMTPLWRKNKSEVEDDEYNDFYRSSFHAWDNPVDIIHTKGEGTIEYTALLFIPEKTPFDFYSSHFERGLKLYSKQVFIMDKCKELLPEYLGFVKGLIDSPDFSLNISREILQHSRQLKTIAKKVEGKVIDSLKYMLKTDRDKYENFWKEFGKSIKAGVYSEYGANKEKLQDLLLFSSSQSDKETTLREYVDRMKEDQKEIFYAAGKDVETIERMPQMEMFKEKDVEVLYFIDKIDEFTSMTLKDYDGKSLKSIASGDIDLDTEEEKKAHKEDKEKLEKENKSLLETIKENLTGKVTDVQLSNRLKSTAVCIVSQDQGMSLNMEQIMAEAGQDMMMGQKAQKILEINPDHKLFSALKNIYGEDAKSEKLKQFSTLLYDQALLMEGVPLENPVKFANMVSDLMINA